MTVTYMAVEEDFARAARLMARARSRTLLGLRVIVVGLALSVLVPRAMAPTLRSRLPALGVAAALLAASALVQRSNRALHEFRFRPGVCTLQLTEGEIRVQAPSFAERVPWTRFTFHAEDPKLVLLASPADRLLLPIPKRDLSPSQLEELRALLETHGKLRAPLA